MVFHHQNLKSTYKLLDLYPPQDYLLLQSWFLLTRERMGSKFPQYSEDNSQESLTCRVVGRTDLKVNFTKIKHPKEKWKVLYTLTLPELLQD